MPCCAAAGRKLGQGTVEKAEKKSLSLTALSGATDRSASPLSEHLRRDKKKTLRLYMFQY